MYGSITVDDIINKIGELSADELSRVKDAIKLVKPSITRVVQDLDDWTWVYYKGKSYHIDDIDSGYTDTGIVIEIELEDSNGRDIDYDDDDHVLYVAENEKFAMSNSMNNFIISQMIVDVSEGNSTPKLVIFGLEGDEEIDEDATYEREEIK